MIFLKKILAKGFNGTFVALKNRITKYLFKIFPDIPLFLKIKQNNFVANFKFEGETKIKIPRFSIFNYFLFNSELKKKSVTFFETTNSHVLLRKVMYELFKINYLDADKSIIDIGSYIGDNSIVWSKFLKNNGKVFAIDPYDKNLEFGKMIAGINNITNIEWIEAACSDEEKDLRYGGSLDHVSFKEEVNQFQKIFKANTLDNLMKKNINKITLLHVDVEGLELEVLKGAKKIIEKSKPTITFEQHISLEKFSHVTEFIRSFGYQVFMINEVIPNNYRDCRNFIAFDQMKPMPIIQDFDQHNARLLGIWSATVGPSLIKIN